MPLTTDQFNDSWPAVAHESWLCRDAFHRFQLEGKSQIIANPVGWKPTRESNFAAYSAYEDFVQHLHGTYMAFFDMEVYLNWDNFDDLRRLLAGPESVASILELDRLYLMNHAKSALAMAAGLAA